MSNRLGAVLSTLVGCYIDALLFVPGFIAGLIVEASHDDR